MLASNTAFVSLSKWIYIPVFPRTVATSASYLVRCVCNNLTIRESLSESSFSSLNYSHRTSCNIYINTIIKSVIEYKTFGTICYGPKLRSKYNIENGVTKLAVLAKSYEIKIDIIHIQTYCKFTFEGKTQLFLHFYQMKHCKKTKKPKTTYRLTIRTTLHIFYIFCCELARH